MLYYIEEKTGPRLKWKRSPFDRGRALNEALTFARELDEHGACVRVASADGKEVIRI